jgi:hypothetical protein
MEQAFPIAPYDRMAKVATPLVCVMILGIGLIPHVPAFAWGIAILIIVLSWAWAPRGYVIGDGFLTVPRPVGGVRIPLSGIREARPAASDDLSGCIRVMGSGGVFGYYGLFRTSKLGISRWFVTDRSKAIVVFTSARTLVLSPADTEGFLKALGVPASAPSVSFAPSGGMNARTGIGIAVGAIALAVAALSVLYSPGPPTYTLTQDALTIHDRFYAVTLQASAVDAGQIRVIDLTQEPDWRATAKTNAFANAHYQSGWFRLANGKTVEMYRAGGDQLVLLPGKDGATTVLYQAREPEQFAAEVRREWLP